MSGQTYVTDIPRISSPDVCPPGASEYTIDELKAPYTDGFGGIGVRGDTVAVDSTTNRIPSAALAEAKRIIPGRDGNRKIVRPDGSLADIPFQNMDGLVANDTELFKNLHAEYCYYEQRYTYALKKFLDFATSRNPSDNKEAENLLDTTIILNRRLNFMIEFMNYLAVDRATEANSNVASINTLNASILKTQAELQTVFDKIKKLTAVTDTQKEMIRYTKEKNNNVTNQISVWAALNVLAIATIFYVYRSS